MLSTLVTMTEMGSASLLGRQVKVMPNICQRLIIDIPSLTVESLNLSVDTLSLNDEVQSINVEVRNLSVESLSINDESSTLNVDMRNLSVESRNLNRHSAPHSSGLSGFFFAFALLKHSSNWFGHGFEARGSLGGGLT